MPLNLTPPGIGYSTDEAFLPLSDGPVRELVERTEWWPYASGDDPAGVRTGVMVRVPDSWIAAPPPSGSQPNRGAAALRVDGKAQEFQYVVRPRAGSNISIHGGVRAVLDLASGDGLTSQATGAGAHGGSGMTAIGGTIRAGELSSPFPIRHALALTMNMRKWGSKKGGGFTWPAVSADDYYDQTGSATGYGTIGTTSRDGVVMGALLAIPASVDLNSLGFETPQGRKIAQAHQDYGAYIVDDSVDPGTFDVHRLNVEIDVLTEYPEIDTGYTTDTPFGRDMNRIFTRLALVDNNGPSSIGGGGTPRCEAAPRFTS